MTRRYHANNIFTTLASSITAAATTVTITSATGFPTLAANETFRITVSSNNTREIMICTARSGVTLTVTRAAESTTALSFPAGSVVEIRATADSFDRKADMVSTAGDVLNFGDATSLEIPNNATATLSNAGEVALDTSVTDFADGVLCYRAGSTDYGVVAVPKSGLASPVDTYVVTYDAATDKFKLAAAGGGGGGDVVGPASSTDNAITRFDSTTGKLLQNSGALLDDNNNIVSNRHAPAYTTTVTSGSAITLTAASTQVRYLTGTTAQTINLPVVSTLTTGDYFVIVNNSTAASLVRASGTDTVKSVEPGFILIARCILTSGTTAASWGVEHFPNFGASTYTSVTLSNSDNVLIRDQSAGNALAYVASTSIASQATALGTIATGTWQANVIQPAYGGTGNSTYTNGQLLIGNTSGNTLTKATLTAGSGISITNGTGSITIAATGGGGVTDGDKGDVTVASSGTVWTIDTPSSITVVANDKVLLKDSSASDVMGYATVQDIANITPASRTLFFAYSGSTQSINNSTITKVTLDTESFDTPGWFDSATNYRYTPLEAGKYCFIGSIGMGAMTDQGYFNVLIRKNGSTIAQAVLTQSAATSNGMAATAAVTVDMNGSTDYIELGVFQTTGGAKSTLAGATITFLTGYKL